MLRLLTALAALAPVPLGLASPAHAGCWAPPVAAPVVESFEAPACPWCAGHRGLEFGPTSDSPVRAVAPGVVSFVGAVAGITYVSVDLDDGRRVTYGWLSSVTAAEGAVIAAGQLVGIAGPRLMLTVRRDGEYLDPAPFLGRLVHRPWLVPADGAPPRAPPPAELRCPGR